MARMQLALVIGGAVAASVGAAFKSVEGRIQKLEEKGNKAKVLKATIGETMKLQAEWKKAHDTGAAGADKLLRKLNGNLDSLRKQGVEVGRLTKEYQRLGHEEKAASLQFKGHQKIQQGKSGLKTSVGAAAVGMGLTAIPTKISADYQAIIRDIAIKADKVNTPEELQLSRTVIQTSKDTGMGRDDVAALINQLVGAGMDLDKAMAYAPTAAKFAVGQGASGVDTASMIMALQQNAKITDPKVMEQALEAIAYQGQAGSFEASDMAKWFPQLLAGMEKNGITGLESVTSLGAMLQVQMKTAGSSDEAANNFKNWMEKIGAGDVVKAYKDVGIDYQASLNTGLQKGMSVIESSMALAMKYVEATDPAKAKKIKDAQAGIDKEVDPEKAKAALEALEKTLRTGDLFADMQVKAALTAYAQNRGLYSELKADSQKATGILDKNLAERRETSSQRWAELGQAWNDSMRSIGDAIRPATDAVAQGLTAILGGITKLSDKLPAVVMGIAGLTSAVIALMTARSAAKVARGVFNVARGRAWGRRRTGGAESAPYAASMPVTGNPVVDAGLGALGKVLGAPASNDPSGPAGGEPLRVFVVNTDAFGRMSSTVANSSPAEPGSRRARRRRRRQAASLSPSRPSPSVPALPAVKPPRVPVPAAHGPTLVGAADAAGEATRLGRMLRSVRGVTQVMGRLPGGKLVDAVPSVLDTALNAETRDEKAEGYGGAAGGVAGAWAGAAAGAAIGSVVPVIGTAIGGAIGMALGGLGGDALGGWLGKKLFGEDKTQQVADVQPEAKGTPKAEIPAIGATVVATAPPVAEAAKPDAVSVARTVPKAELPAIGATVAATAPPEAEAAKPDADSVASTVPKAELPAIGATVAATAPPVAEAAKPDAVSVARRVPKAELPVIGATVAATAPPVPEAAKPDAAPQPAPGAVVRELVKTAPPPPQLQEVAKAAAPAKPTAKVDQAFNYSPSSSIVVQGDVKDPAQLARELEPYNRRQFEQFMREVSGREATKLLYDDPHL